MRLLIAVCLTAVLAAPVLAAASAPTPSKTITVDAAGHGNFTTVQAAVDSVPDGNTTPVTIRIQPGHYMEHVSLPKGKDHLTLIGLGKTPDQVWIGHGAATRDERATLAADDSDLTVENLTIENTAGPTAGPQMALYTSGQRQLYRHVVISGWQDTLGVWDGSLDDFQDCTILGSVDFIYSGGTGLFQHCTVIERRDTGGDLTAPSTPQDQPYGLVFRQCLLTATANVRPGSTGLMRPWRPYGMSAFIDCTMGPDLSARGWDPWDGRETTCRAFEYGSRTPEGKLIDLSQRAPWVQRLTPAQAAQDTAAKVLGGWDPGKP